MRINGTDDTAVYNSLEPVEIADRKLTKLERDPVLQELGLCIIAFGLHKAIGVRLLHRHNDLTVGEIMLENEERDSDQNPCLSTVAKLRAEASLGYRPNSWKLAQNCLVPIEFSLDSEAVRFAPEFDVRLDFRAEFTRLLKKLEVEDLLGPWIAPRSFYRHNPGNNSMLLESSDTTRRANVLRYGEPAKHTSKVIETSWTFSPLHAEDATTNCSTHCQSNCVANCTVVTGCVVDSDGNHNTQTGHDSSHTLAGHAILHD